MDKDSKYKNINTSQYSKHKKSKLKWFWDESSEVFTFILEIFRF